MQLFSDSLPTTGITARDNMRWQEQMANTAHQREVADLQAAGINPVLTAGTSGAAVGSGSQDSAEVIQLLNGAVSAVSDTAQALSRVSSRSGFGSSVDRGLEWSSVFGALGMNKFQAQGLEAVLDALDVTPEDAIHIASNAAKAVKSAVSKDNLSKADFAVKSAVSKALNFDPKSSGYSVYQTSKDGFSGRSGKFETKSSRRKKALGSAFVKAFTSPIIV